MAVVTAQTFADEDRDQPPREVSGEHRTRHVPALGYTQHFAGDTLVDPATIETRDDAAGPADEPH